MGLKLSPLAEKHIQEIWGYTFKTWGEEQADAYIGGLFDFIAELEMKRHRWRAVPRASLRGAFYGAYREHFVFFRQLPGDELGILAICHQRQDIPSLLREIL